jgi:hypothetical protein
MDTQENGLPAVYLQVENVDLDKAWLLNAIEVWAKRNGDKSFTEAVNDLLVGGLERYGYTRERYEPRVIYPPLWVW